MSIWTSFCTFGGSDGHSEPYANFMDDTNHYTTNKPESLASTERGGFMDVARSGMCDLYRFSIEDETVWLDKTQVTRLRNELTRELER